MRHALLQSLALAAVLATGAATRAEMSVRGITLAHQGRGDGGYGSDACRGQLDVLRELGTNWVAINPFAFMNETNVPTLRFNDRGEGGRAAQARVIRDARERGLKVLIKPHVWLGRGRMPIDVTMTSEADWDTWFASYGQYILTYAKLAQETGAEALCIGCELQGTTKQTVRWRKLIAEVRSVYSGKLTYASAFEEWRQIEFWPELDCVGINAYWKLADTQAATEADLRAGWQRVFDELEPFSRRVGRDICFTEIGYTTSVTAAMEPWSWNVQQEDPALQERLFRVAMDEISKRKFVNGVFVWKWFTAHNETARRRDAFAVQYQPAVREVLKKAWAPPAVAEPAAK